MTPQTIFRALPQKDGTLVQLYGPWQLKSAFQPIFSLGLGQVEIAGFEGLIRPFLAGRNLSPGFFFKNITKADRFAIETLTRDLHMKNAATLPVKNAMLFVNIDPSAFNNILDVSAALSGIRRIWAKTGASPSKLVCEITEQKCKTPALLYSLADAIKANGFKLAIDDYGSDHSDAERLARLRPDIVKFDGRWVTRLLGTKAGYDLLKSMVAQFSGRGIETVFEGIEELWQLELSEMTGTTFVQGFALARPEIAPTTFGRFIAPPQNLKQREMQDALRDVCFTSVTPARSFRKYAA